VLETFNSQGPRSAALGQQKADMEAALKIRKETLRRDEQAMEALTLGGVVGAVQIEFS
jgi:hypothetical protein